VVLDLDYALVGVCNPEVDYGVDPGRDIVAGYDVLGRDVHGHGPQVYLDHPVDQGIEDEEPWSLGPSLDPAEAEDHTPLVLLDDLDGTVQDRRHHHYGHYQDDEREAHKTVLLSGCYESCRFYHRQENARHERGPYWRTSLSRFPSARGTS
jgi:hypothetical protein